MYGSVFVPGGHGVYPEHKGEEEVNGEIAHQAAGQGQQTQAYTQVPADKSSVYFSSSYNRWPGQVLRVNTRQLRLLRQ